MVFDEVESKKVTKIQISISLLLVLFFSIVGATYAYFAVSATDTNTITGNAATVNLTLNVERVFPLASSVNTGVLVPQLSVSGNSDSPLATALRNGCVDSNSNVVCQVYKIDIQNQGGTATQVVDGKVAFYGDAAFTKNIQTDMPNLKWKLITSVDTSNVSSSVLGTAADNSASSTLTNFVSNLTMKTNERFFYYMIIWIDETNRDQPVDEGKTFYGKIQFDSSNGTGVTSTFQT